MGPMGRDSKTINRVMRCTREARGSGGPHMNKPPERRENTRGVMIRIGVE